MRLVKTLTKNNQQFQLLIYIAYICNNETGIENPEKEEKSYQMLNNLKDYFQDKHGIRHCTNDNMLILQEQSFGGLLKSSCPEKFRNDYYIIFVLESLP